MPRQWTQEQRKELGERMRAMQAARREKKVQEEVAPNPIATDVVVPEHARRIINPSRLRAVTETPVAKPSFSAQALIDSLRLIPLESVTYVDCGLLLNALSAASTAIALTRRQRQEQLEAGSQRATCKTCGRQIDISRAGGFQILTERDEHHMPKNSYYCSQNCLLARNMPSHARSTPREKKENRA